MKKISLMTLCFTLAMLFVSCKPDKDEKDKMFIGTWGVDKIEYYNIDYAGNPIEASMETYDMTPGDPQSGIDLVFRADKTGEMRDRSQDTIYTDWNSETQQYETILVRPDTTLVTTFTYHFDEESSILYLNMSYARTFSMGIQELTDNSFIYTNEYDVDYVERAYMKRLTDAKASSEKQTVRRPNKPGSFLGER